MDAGRGGPGPELDVSLAYLQRKARERAEQANREWLASIHGDTLASFGLAFKRATDHTAGTLGYRDAEYATDTQHMRPVSDVMDRVAHVLRVEPDYSTWESWDAWYRMTDRPYHDEYAERVYGD